MAHVGRALVKLRLDAEKPREVPYAEKKRRMVEHVKSRMDEMCCAQLPDGTEECAAKYCIIHVKRTMTKRATHVARKMTEANHPKAVEHLTSPRRRLAHHAPPHPAHPHAPAIAPPVAWTWSTRTCTTTRRAACQPLERRGTAGVHGQVHPAPRGQAARLRRRDAAGEARRAEHRREQGPCGGGQDVWVPARGSRAGQVGLLREAGKDEAAASALMRESRARSEAKQAAAAVAQAGGGRGKRGGGLWQQPRAGAARAARGQHAQAAAERERRDAPRDDGHRPRGDGGQQPRSRAGARRRAGTRARAPHRTTSTGTRPRTACPTRSRPCWP